MKAKEKLAIIVAVGALLGLTACDADADGDGYDDETGKPILATAAYTWDGDVVSVVTYIRHGDNVVMQTAEPGRVSVPIFPGNGAAVSVRGENVSCSISVKGEYDSDSGAQSAECVVPGVDVW